VSHGKRYLADTGKIRHFRLIWEDIIYQPVEVLAVAYDKDRNEAIRSVVRTADKPYGVNLRRINKRFWQMVTHFLM